MLDGSVDPGASTRLEPVEELHRLGTEELQERLEALDARIDTAAPEHISELLRFRGRLLLVLARRPKESGTRLGSFEEEVDVFVGTRIRMARARAGISQRRLASAVGLTRTQLCRTERGTRATTVAELLRLAIELQQPVTFFTKPPLPEIVTTGWERPAG